MTCKDEYENVLKDISNDAEDIRSMNKDKAIKGIKDIIGYKGIFPLDKIELSDEDDARTLLLALKRRDWVRKEDSVLCKCIIDEGLNQKNVEKIIGTKNAQFARNALIALGIK